MSKRFDAMAAKKIINEYAEWVNLYIKENNILKEQLKDMKITLNINKNLMFRSLNGESIIEELKKENLRLSELINGLNLEKGVLDKKVSI
jgi:hypothetical protein